MNEPNFFLNRFPLYDISNVKSVLYEIHQNDKDFIFKNKLKLNTFIEINFDSLIMIFPIFINDKLEEIIVIPFSMDMSIWSFMESYIEKIKEIKPTIKYLLLHFQNKEDVA